jgi:hypothetical protein
MKIDLHPHPSVPGLFLTRDGRVFRELAGYTDTNGYRCIHVQSGTGKNQIIRRHTLIAETFVGPRPHGQGVRHRDGNPANDLPTNLEWGTQAENTADTVRHGRSTRGERNARAKLTEAEARAIKQRRAAGESGKSLATEFNTSQATICDIQARRTWAWL